MIQLLRFSKNQNPSRGRVVAVTRSEDEVTENQKQDNWQKLGVREEFQSVEQRKAQTACDAEKHDLVKVMIKKGVSDGTEESLGSLETTNDLYAAKCSFKYRILVMLVSSFQLTLLAMLINDSIQVFNDSTACYKRGDLVRIVFFFNPFITLMVTYYLTTQVSESSIESVVMSRLAYFPKSRHDFIFYLMSLFAYLISVPVLMLSAIPYVLHNKYEVKEKDAGPRKEKYSMNDDLEQRENKDEIVVSKGQDEFDINYHGGRISMFFDISYSCLCGVTVFYIVASYATPMEMIINMLGVLAIMELDTIVCFFAKAQILTIVIFEDEDEKNLGDEMNKASQAYGFLMFTIIYMSLNYNYFWYICSDQEGCFETYWGNAYC
jgi:hypothetical protein